MEAASLVFGVIPLFVEILKSYHTIRNRLHAFAHAREIMEELQLALETVSSKFCSECILLLKRTGVDKHVFTEMVEDPEHSGWKASGLVDRVHQFLGRDFHVYKGNLSQILKKLDDVGLEFQHLCDGSSTGSISRLRRMLEDVKFAFGASRKEPRYRALLKEIDGWIADIRTLRKQHIEYESGTTLRVESRLRSPMTAVPKAYAETRRASLGLYGLLQEAFLPYTIDADVEIRAKLSFGTGTKKTVSRLDMMIAQGRITRTSGQTSTKEPLIWLSVQPLTETSSGIRRSRKGANVFLRDSESGCSDTSYEEDSDPGPHRPILSRPTSANGSLTSQVSLMHHNVVNSICDHLRWKHAPATKPATGCTMPCLGYTVHDLDRDALRLWFYDASEHVGVRKYLPAADGDSRAVNTLLNHLTPLQQCHFAHRLAEATLKYHSTPWLTEDWHLQQIYYVDSSKTGATDPFRKRLRSFHFNTQVSKSQSSALGSSTPDRAQEDSRYLRTNLGIRNIPLARLGVALLQIGCNAEINHDIIGPQQHDVITARETLHHPPSSMQGLGLDYLKMVQKCVDCDFSQGNDLGNDRLQAAVYTEIICGLSEKIAELEVFLDE